MTDKKYEWKIATIQLNGGYIITDRTLDSKEDYNTFCEKYGCKLLSFEEEN